MRKIGLWLLALVLTVVAAAWQRLSGPTWPVRGEALLLTGETVRFRLPRSAEVGSDLKVAVDVGDANVSGFVRCKRVPSREEWQYLALSREGGQLVAFLPEQPPAGKLAYQFVLAPEEPAGAGTPVPEEPVVVRFKGHVPAGLLIPHIAAMFFGMLFANRAGFSVVFREDNPRRWILPTLALLVFGGLVLGPLVQKAAFGAYWTGFPVGQDLTDTKTLAVVLAWVWAAFRSRGERRWPILVAAAVTLLVFAIPHSLLGSQINWDQVEP